MARAWRGSPNGGCAWPTVSCRRPPHNASGHTWHHGDAYLVADTKYGVARVLGQPYPNAMPIYDGVLSDKEIVAVLSYIKSQWPAEIQSRHDRLNQRLRAQNN